jgi:hypothetical protein
MTTNNLLNALETVERVLRGEQVLDIMVGINGPCLGDIIRDAIHNAKSETPWTRVSVREPLESEYPVACIDYEGARFCADSHASLTCFSAEYWLSLPPSPK